MRTLGSAVLASAERIAAALALEQAELPATLAKSSGEWKGSEVEIVSRAWKGSSVAWARLACLHGEGVEAASLLVISRSSYALPTLGADLVSIGGRGGMVSAGLELDPVGDAPVRRAVRMPRARVAGERLPRVAQMLDAFVDEWITTARVAREVDPLLHPTVLRDQEAFARAHRTGDKSLGLIARIFDPRWAEKFLAQVLFPDLGSTR
ncbi:MAG: uncharacterized protein JWO05_93 [Gemmatimonadetes bacterium]|nr:uncharacterized protein [Gemmatimonadota bacterium]